MAVTRDRSGPYAPSSAIVDLIDRRRNRGLQPPFNAEVLQRAGVSDSLIPRTLQALQTLDLIDENGAPTPAFEAIRLAPESEYKQRLAEWVKGAYAEVFAFVDPMVDDESRIRDAFRGYEPSGQMNRMVTLFTGLCKAAGLMPEASKPPSAPRPRVAPAKTPPKIQPKLQPKTQLRSAGALPPALAGLLESLPDPSEGWSAADRERFMATFKAVLDYSIPVVNQEKENGGQM